MSATNNTAASVRRVSLTAGAPRVNRTGTPSPRRSSFEDHQTATGATTPRRNSPSNLTPPQKPVAGSKTISPSSKFTVMFTSKMAERRFYCPGETRPAPLVPTSARKDLNMKSQYSMVQAAHLFVVHAKWVSDNCVNIERPQTEEKHFLHILIRTAIFRQMQHKSTYLSSLILAKSDARKQQKQQNDTNQSGSPRRNSGPKGVSATEAFNLVFVCKKLTEDIDLVFQRYGYKATLQSLMQLDAWQI